MVLLQSLRDEFGRNHEAETMRICLPTANYTRLRRFVPMRLRELLELRLVCQAWTLDRRCKSSAERVGKIKLALGLDERILKDPTGKAFGRELYAAAQKPEGEITEVSALYQGRVGPAGMGDPLCGLSLHHGLAEPSDFAGRH
jgi:hypothetical protein